MRRGTTPWIELTLDGCYKTIVITLKQGIIEINKNKDDLTIEENMIRFQLTQKETLGFRNDRKVQIQLRAVDDVGNAITTDIISASVQDVLNEEVIE